MADFQVSDRIDRAFVFELAKRGKVRVLSHQVSIEGESVDLKGIKIPDGVTIDWFGAMPNKDEWHPVARITFNFLGEEMEDGKD